MGVICEREAGMSFRVQSIQTSNERANSQVKQEQAVGGPDRVQLSLEELKEKLDNAKGGIVVECFAWWCPHCKKFASSVFEAHAKAESDPGKYYPIVSIDLAKMDRKSVIPETCTNLSEYLKVIVPGYPTVAKIRLDGTDYTSTLMSTATRDKQHLLQFAEI